MPWGGGAGLGRRLLTPGPLLHVLSPIVPVMAVGRLFLGSVAERVVGTAVP